MTIEIKVSTAVTFLLGPFVDVTDGVAAETGLATAMDNATTGIRVSKNGGNMADRSDATAPVHDEDGFYTVVLDTTDTNALGHLQVEYSEVATCLPAWQDFAVVTANYWDTKYGADQFDVNVTNMAANSIATGVIATDAIGTAAMAAGSISAGTIASGELTNIEDEIWDALKSAHTTPDSFGDYLDDEITSRGTSTFAIGEDVNVASMDANSIAVGVIALDAIGITAFAPNAIGTDVMAASSITAAVIATDAIDADALATDAVNEIARAIGIQKNATFSDMQFLMLDSTDSKTPKTGLTVAGTMSIDAAAYVAVNGTIVEVANGTYQIDLTADDTNGNVIVYRFTSAGADDTFVTIKTVA